MKELAKLGDESTRPLRVAAIKARLAYEQTIVALVEATGENPVKIEDGLISALVIAELAGIDLTTLDFDESTNTTTEERN